MFRNSRLKAGLKTLDNLVYRVLNICFLACLLIENVVGQQPRLVLKPNEPTEGKLKGGDVQGFRINLKANQFMRIIVEQRGVDVVRSLYAPDGNLLEERDRPNAQVAKNLCRLRSP